MSGIPAWHNRAACGDTAGRDWFPVPRAPIDPALLALCRSCPVWRDCLLSALADEQLWDGVWAGLSAYELAQLRDALRCGELGADVVDQAHELVQGRTAALYYPRVFLGRRGGTQSRAKVVEILRRVGLLNDRDPESERAA
jgi:Transcription factor WhiB